MHSHTIGILFDTPIPGTFFQLKLLPLTDKITHVGNISDIAELSSANLNRVSALALPF
jgi:hypothetical protein